MQMKNFYKRIVGGKITQLHAHPHPVDGDDLVEITETEYNRLQQEMAQHAEDVRLYTEQVKAGTLQLVDVPEDCREEVTRNIDSEKVADYTEQVVAGTIRIEDVSEQYRAEVEKEAKARVDARSADYKAGYDQAVLDLMEV